jgi:hypothetical protein
MQTARQLVPRPPDVDLSALGARPGPVAAPRLSAAAVAAFLNSNIGDRMFRCISGRVVVSAFELRSMLVPLAAAMGAIERLVGRRAGRVAIEAATRGLYLGGISCSSTRWKIDAATAAPYVCVG